MRAEGSINCNITTNVVIKKGENVEGKEKERKNKNYIEKSGRKLMYSRTISNDKLKSLDTLSVNADWV